ncbi:cytochrome P450-like protein [Arabidopsis thaliana]|uniref:Cytochrome P450, family 96, subfamily A, polypeptide 13 n=1 Tax=Arabidopsis thaliana TaxID=3702 RepID=Q9LYZ5_ARATH|nr:cytochrome P450, family 96, subfamily A, polypeptide 13 [Arabidopsis thaliana]AED90533.1 cytochrome P450, family 96, subfamily A, polypeptide 13 [Arabidopsis thaliana]CAB86044.1 cytochrome P450-like protein [Arabidopsis thaliana]|eukprot:NP_195910.1 cytochrome P450, family 96, subfamily A, polypeptide 13 [Arabidopsis thaliana]
MASISLFEASIAIFCFIILHFFLGNWPVLGMLPGLLLEFHRIYDFSVEVLENSDLTFPFKGPWFTGMDMLFTVDPTNIHHIMSSNFSNYTKGPDFKQVFDVFGDGILTTDDSELWKNLKKASLVMLNHQGFQKNGTVVDLQDVFKRFMFDTTLVTVTGSADPRSLSIEMPEVEFAKALDHVGEGIMHRHVRPRLLWKLQKCVGFGQEKKFSKADATLNQACAKYILEKREETRSQGFDYHSNGSESEDILTYHIKIDTTKYELLNPSDDKFLRDTILAFVLAGRDTTASALTWFFWLLLENPQVVTKIRQEINTSNGGQEKPSCEPMEYLNNLVYLHGALYEAMRLYPPVPFERMSPIKPDVLPSGHKVDSSMKILIFIYALGRMRAVWGEDASEFKPERWLSETTSLRHEPSFKFLAFNAGPRSCIGKQLAMTLMKIVVVEILQNYDIKVVKGQKKIEPAPGPILRMKHGLRVTLTKKC